MMGQVELRASELREQLYKTEAAAGVTAPQLGAVAEEDAMRSLLGAKQGELEYDPERWKAATDEAAQKLREVQDRRLNADVKKMVPGKFEELEQRLAAAERAVGQLAPGETDRAEGAARGRTLTRGMPYTRGMPQARAP